jgi:hypothetical protein
MTNECYQPNIFFENYGLSVFENMSKQHTIYAHNTFVSCDDKNHSFTILCFLNRFSLTAAV